MDDFLEFVEAAWDYWGSAVITLSVAAFIWVINYLYKQGSGSEGLPWYVSVIIFLLFSPFIGYRLWIDQKHVHRKEIQNLKESHQQTKDTLHQQIITFKDQLDTRARRREQREKLTDFIEEGKRIQGLYGTPGNTFVTEVEAWICKVYTYLQENLGRAYITQWENEEGLVPFKPPAPLPSLHLTSKGEIIIPHTVAIHTPRSKARQTLSFRITRLYELLARLIDQ
jgi:hypothetical protein